MARGVVQFSALRNHHALTPHLISVRDTSWVDTQDDASNYYIEYTDELPV
jgi:hypothetical protein